MTYNSRKILFFLSASCLMITIAAATVLNYKQDKDVDRSKLPEKLETSKQFQKWITNLKNKDLNVEADEFKLVEENEIYNTKWMNVSNIDEPGVLEQFNENITKYTETKGVVYSPSGRQFIDYRNVPRDGYGADKLHYYGLRDEKLLDARLLDCPESINCYFDRAYFLDNDVFVISEFSRNIDKKSPVIPPCAKNETCIYSIKVHLIDLNKNSRMVFESLPFDINLDLLIPEL